MLSMVRSKNLPEWSCLVDFSIFNQTPALVDPSKKLTPWWNTYNLCRVPGTLVDCNRRELETKGVRCQVAHVRLYVPATSPKKKSQLLTAWLILNHKRTTTKGPKSRSKTREAYPGWMHSVTSQSFSAPIFTSR